MTVLCNIAETRLYDCYAQGEYGICFWTAGQRLDPSPRSESEFVWRVLSADNENVSEMTYTNWYPGQPSNHKGNEGCMLMWSGRKYKWNDQHCTRSPMCSVCEIDMEPPAGPTKIMSELQDSLEDELDLEVPPDVSVP